MTTIKDPNGPPDKVLMIAPKIKNKAPASQQITAAQILIDAQIHQNKDMKLPQQRVMDEAELEDYKAKKRKDFEDNLRKQRQHLGTWLKYAHWEESLQEFARARSIFERLLDVDYKNSTLWLKYAEMEMRNKFLNHARNIWERAITLLPRVDQLWYKYSYMEEMIGNYVRARSIFDRWMTWKPEEKAWLAFVKFEERIQEFEKAREVLYRYMEAHPRQLSFLRVAKYEWRNKNREYARKVFEKALHELPKDELTEDFYIDFAKFELKSQEAERARTIYRLGLSRIAKEKAKRLYDAYLAFEKTSACKEEIDLLVTEKRRAHYTDILTANPINYDAWFDLIALETSAKDFNRVRECYEAAISHVPPMDNKRFWRRYMYLWYSYAFFEEFDVKSPTKANEVYERALKIVPHSSFSFGKLWIFTAQLHLRQHDLEKARKVFGIAIAKCPKEKVFMSYAEIEMQLMNIDRVRKIYEKFIEVIPQSSNSWIKYAELELSLGENERARAIYEIAINQQQILNMPESVWKAYIDMEIQFNEYEKVRFLYERLLDITKHVKVWTSYIKFEESIEQFIKVRGIFGRCDEHFKMNPEMKEERVMMLEMWKTFEEKFGNEEEKAFVKAKLPKRVKKQKKITVKEGENETETRYEEYYDYIFPDDPNQSKNIKILQKAYAWKNKVAVDLDSNGKSKTE